MGAAGSLVWGLVESVAGDGTLTVLAGAYRQRLTRRPDEVARWERGPGKYNRTYPNRSSTPGRSS
jgi:hypothetical protein